MKKKIRIVVFVIALLVFLVSLYNVVRYYYFANQLKTQNNELITKAVTPGEIAPISVDFDVLNEENEDIIAWIYQENTLINYPILQSEDNSYYLRRLINGKYNIAGSIFMDYRNSPDFSDKNTIIYGHNMNNDSMFASVEYYKKQEYYDAHKTAYIITPEKAFKVHFVSGYVAKASGDQFSTFKDDGDFGKYMEEALSKSTFKADYEYKKGDRIVTLSTCVYDFRNARYVLLGVLEEISKN
ncbi:MAG: class B sortase [Clostridia bacterium]|nr:class B sortase [Clostridia bacterium]